MQAGYTHSVAIQSDGTVWTWGSNSFGEIGDGTIVGRTSPVHISGIGSAQQIAAGNEDTLVLKNDGTIWSWGYSSAGQLTDGTSSVVSTVSPILGLSGITQMSVGDVAYHSLFIGAGGALYAVGQNCYGELGNGTTTPSAGPVAVNMSNLGSAIACAVGRFHSLAIKSDGTVWAWGLNSNGQLGNNSTTNSSVPVQVSGLTNVVAVSAGVYFSMALKSDGTLWSWGGDANGELSRGAYTQYTTPVQVKTSSSTYLTNVKQVASGSYFSAALKNDGTVWVWGINTYYQIAGYNVSQQLYAAEAKDPNDSSGYVSNVASIAVGSNNVLALKNDGTVSAWGENANGQIGPNGGYDTTTPVSISFSSPVVQLAAGYLSSYAMTSDGKLWSWGDNSMGELGDGTTTSRSSVAQFGTATANIKLSAAAYLGLILKPDGTVFSWGSQNQGQAGEGISYNLPSQSPGLNVVASTPTPTVSITTPSNNATVNLGSSTTFTATASETGGTVSSVKYYINSTLVGTSTTGSSYSLTWSPTTWGNFTFNAIATDASGYTSYLSPPVTVQVPYDSEADGLPDWWEVTYFGNLSYGAGDSPDGNGISLATDYAQGNDPTNYYSQNGTIIPHPRGDGPI